MRLYENVNVRKAKKNESMANSNKKDTSLKRFSSHENKSKNLKLDKNDDENKLKLCEKRIPSKKANDKKKQPYLMKRVHTKAYSSMERPITIKRNEELYNNLNKINSKWYNTYRSQTMSRYIERNSNTKRTAISTTPGVINISNPKKKNTLKKSINQDIVENVKRSNKQYAQMTSEYAREKYQPTGGKESKGKNKTDDYGSPINKNREKWESNSSDKNVHKCSDRSVHKSSDRSVHKSSDRSVHKSSDRSLHKNSDRSVHKSSDKNVHKKEDENMYKDNDKSVHKNNYFNQKAVPHLPTTNISNTKGITSQNMHSPFLTNIANAYDKINYTLPIKNNNMIHNFSEYINGMVSPIPELSTSRYLKANDRSPQVASLSDLTKENISNRSLSNISDSNGRSVPNEGRSSHMELCIRNKSTKKLTNSCMPHLENNHIMTILKENKIKNEVNNCSQQQKKNRIIQMWDINSHKIISTDFLLKDKGRRSLTEKKKNNQHIQRDMLVYPHIQNSVNEKRNSSFSAFKVNTDDFNMKKVSTERELLTNVLHNNVTNKIEVTNKKIQNNEHVNLNINKGYTHSHISNSINNDTCNYASHSNYNETHFFRENRSYTDIMLREKIKNKTKYNSDGRSLSKDNRKLKEPMSVHDTSDLKNDDYLVESKLMSNVPDKEKNRSYKGKVISSTIKSPNLTALENYKNSFAHNNLVHDISNHKLQKRNIHMHLRCATRTNDYFKKFSNDEKKDAIYYRSESEWHNDKNYININDRQKGNEAKINHFARGDKIKSNVVRNFDPHKVNFLNLTNPSLINQNLINPNLINSNLINTNLTNPNLINPSLTNPNLINPSLTNPNLINPNPTNPNLINPSLTNPNLTNPNRTIPKLTNPNLTNPNLTNPNLTNPNRTIPKLTRPSFTFPTPIQPKKVENVITFPYPPNTSKMILKGNHPSCINETANSTPKENSKINIIDEINQHNFTVLSDPINVHHNNFHSFKKIYIDHNMNEIKNTNCYILREKRNPSIDSGVIAYNAQSTSSTEGKAGLEKFIKCDENSLSAKKESILDQISGDMNVQQMKCPLSNWVIANAIGKNNEIYKHLYMEDSFTNTNTMDECTIDKKSRSSSCYSYQSSNCKNVPMRKGKSIGGNNITPNETMYQQSSNTKSDIIKNTCKERKGSNNNIFISNNKMELKNDIKRTDMVIPENCTIQNFVTMEKRNENDNLENMNTIKFPLRLSELINDTFGTSMSQKKSVSANNSGAMSKNQVLMNNNMFISSPASRSFFSTTLDSKVGLSNFGISKKVSTIGSNVVDIREKWNVSNGSMQNMSSKSKSMQNMSSKGGSMQSMSSKGGSMQSMSSESKSMQNTSAQTKAEINIAWTRQGASNDSQFQKKVSMIPNKKLTNTHDILSKRADSCVISSRINSCNNKSSIQKQHFVNNRSNGIENLQEDVKDGRDTGTTLQDLNKVEVDGKRNGLATCKSISNSDIYNYLRNEHTKTLTNFHRTVSYRNQNLKKQKSFTAISCKMGRKISVKGKQREEQLDVTYEADSKHTIKKAVVIGCNYMRESEENRLYGSVNDAYIFSRVLVKYFDFRPENILLLSDSLPSNAYIYEDFDINREKYIKEKSNYNSLDEENMIKKKNVFNLFNTSNVGSSKEKKSTEMNYCNSCKNLPIKNVDFSSENINFHLWPTRINILKAVNWLVRDSVPLGSYVFYFAGKSVQVDNMSGWEGEGYDEAFLCSDPQNRIQENNVLTAIQLKDLLLSINLNAQMTIILDCSGGQTILDPAGTENSLSYIKGCKQKGIWPITNPTNKVHKAVYDASILNNSSMKKYFCKSRYHKLIEVESTSAMIDPLLQSASSLPIAPKAYCLCAATWEQISIEGLFPIMEFARVTQIKKVDTFEEKNEEKKNKKKCNKNGNMKKRQMKENDVLTNQDLNCAKKNVYEKNFSFSLNVVKMFFNNNTRGEPISTGSSSTDQSKSQNEKNTQNAMIFEEEKKEHCDGKYDNEHGERKVHTYEETNSPNEYLDDTIYSEEENETGEETEYVLVSHGVFTYCLIESIVEFKEKELENNILEKKDQTFSPMTLKNLITRIQKKIENVKNMKLKKLNQKPEYTIHPGANTNNNNYFVHYSKNIQFQNYKFNFINSDFSPFLNVNKAWEEINKNTLRNRKALSVTSTLINTASSKNFSEQNSQIKSCYSLRY